MGTEGSRTNQKQLSTTQLYCLNTTIKEGESFCAMLFKEIRGLIHHFRILIIKK